MKLTALPQTLSWIKGSLFLREEDRKGVEGWKKEEGGEGEEEEGEAWTEFIRGS